MVKQSLATSKEENLFQLKVCFHNSPVQHQNGHTDPDQFLQQFEPGCYDLLRNFLATLSVLHGAQGNVGKDNL